jgi:hypothetical protein
VPGLFGRYPRGAGVLAGRQRAAQEDGIEVKIARFGGQHLVPLFAELLMVVAMLLGAEKRIPSLANLGRHVITPSRQFEVLDGFAQGQRQLLFARF